MNDLISRQQALKEMWKALYEYEDKTEKQFQESKDLDVRDWIMNDRLWVQNGHNLCVNVLANLPSAQPQRKKGKWISEVKGKKAIIDEYGNVTCSAHCSECGDWLTGSDEYACRGRFCPNCGARMEGKSDEML